MNATEELLPCPFCGGRPEFKQYPLCDIIACENPHCPATVSISQQHPNGDHRKAHMLIAAWNRRAEHD